MIVNKGYTVFREILVVMHPRAVTVAEFYHRGGNGPTTTGGAVL